MIARVISGYIFCAIAISCGTAGAQTPGDCAPNDHRGAQPALLKPADQDHERAISWKLLLPNVLCDQKSIWMFPLHVVHNDNWIPALSMAGATAGLIMVDPVEARYFHSTPALQPFDRAFTSKATQVGTVLAPVSLYLAGLARKDAKMQHTALLAGEAAADAEIVDTVLKAATKRARPVAFSSRNNYWDSWFESRGSAVGGNASFPSGHTIAAFSVATVIAHRYRNHRWLPYLVYGAAGAVAFSRLSLSAHFASDVFVGAALGYSISRFAVLRH